MRGNSLAFYYLFELIICVLYNKFKVTVWIKTMKKEKYDLIVSLGAVCSASETLRKNNLQEYSFPFDWIGGMELKDRILLMINDFEGWFNIEDFEYIGQRTHPEPCNIYKNKKTSLEYHHDFAIDTPIEKSYPEAHNRYMRRTKRLKELIEKAKDILFVYIEMPNSNHQYDEEYLKECSSVLANNYNGKNVKLLYLYQTSDSEIKKKSLQNLDIYSVNYEASSDGDERFFVNYDILNKIFKNIKLKLTLKRFINKFIEYKCFKRQDKVKINIKIFGLKLQFSNKRKSVN